jgi:succinate dehydrogenase flavin-adding protein (antitoxin of CptAB toxin-antitoxin module)
LVGAPEHASISHKDLAQSEIIDTVVPTDTGMFDATIENEPIVDLEVVVPEPDYEFDEPLEISADVPVFEQLDEDLELEVVDAEAAVQQGGSLEETELVENNEPVESFADIPIFEQLSDSLEPNARNAEEAFQQDYSLEEAKIVESNEPAEPFARVPVFDQFNENLEHDVADIEAAVQQDCPLEEVEIVESDEPAEPFAHVPVFDQFNENLEPDVADTEAAVLQDCSLEEAEIAESNEPAESFVCLPAFKDLNERVELDVANPDDTSQLDPGIESAAGCLRADFNASVPQEVAGCAEIEDVEVAEAPEAPAHEFEFGPENESLEVERLELIAPEEDGPLDEPDIVEFISLSDIAEPAPMFELACESVVVEQFESAPGPELVPLVDEPVTVDHVELRTSLATEIACEPACENVVLDQAELLPEDELDGSFGEIEIVEFIELSDLPERDSMFGATHESVAVERADPGTSLEDDPLDDTEWEKWTESFAVAPPKLHAHISLFSDFSQKHILEELQAHLSVGEGADLRGLSLSDDGPFSHAVALAVCADVLRSRDGFQPSETLKLRIYEVSRLLAKAEFDSDALRQETGLTCYDLTDDDRQVVEAWSRVLVGIWEELLRHIPNCAQPQFTALSFEETSFPLLGQIQKPLLVPMILMEALHRPAIVDAGYFSELRLILVENTNRLEAELGVEGDQVFQWLTGNSEPHHERAVELVSEIVSYTAFAHFFYGTIDATIQVSEIEDNCCVVGDDAAMRSALLSDLLTSKFDRVLNDELSILIIDSHGELKQSIQRGIFNHPRLDLRKRFVAIDMETASSSGLFNPFRGALKHSNGLVMERLLGESFEIECFVLEAFLGPEVTQDHRSDLRHLMRLLHAIPDPDLSTLLRLSDLSTSQEFSKFVSQIGNSSSRRFFADGFDSQSFGDLARHIHGKLDSLLSDSTFFRATTGAVPANHPIEQTDTGRIILLNLAAEDMCPVRAEVLKRTFIGNMAIERLVKSASPGDHQSMIFCVDDVSQCFGQSSAEYDLMLDHVKNLDGQVCLGHKNSDQLTSDLLRPDFRGLPIILAGNFGLDAKDEETASH